MIELEENIQNKNPKGNNHICIEHLLCDNHCAGSYVWMQWEPDKHGPCPYRASILITASRPWGDVDTTLKPECSSVGNRGRWRHSRQEQGRPCFRKMGEKGDRKSVV